MLTKERYSEDGSQILCNGQNRVYAYRNVKILPDTSFEESGHLTQDGSLDMNAIVKALVDTGFTGYFRPDHGRMIWDEVGSDAKPGYGLYDRALGTAYINGLIEANGGNLD